VTTIATDGRIMAADGLCTGDGIIHDFETVKISKLADGRIVGVAGVPYDLPAFISWLENGGDMPSLYEGFEALVLHADGTVKAYNSKCQFYPQSVPAVSGSGAAIALGAMLAGVDPVRAVEIAAERDMGTGGKIISLAVS